MIHPDDKDRTIVTALVIGLFALGLGIVGLFT